MINFGTPYTLHKAIKKIVVSPLHIYISLTLSRKNTLYILSVNVFEIKNWNFLYYQKVEKENDLKKFFFYKKKLKRFS